MSQGSINLPKHIDPREQVERQVTTEIINLSLMMRDSGSTPYRYIRAAFKKLVEGDYFAAVGWIDYAAKFIGVFYKDKEEDKVFADEIICVRFTILFLIEKFKVLKPEE